MLGFSLKNLLVRLLAVETDIAQRVYGTMIDVNPGTGQQDTCANIDELRNHPTDDVQHDFAIERLTVGTMHPIIRSSRRRKAYM